MPVAKPSTVPTWATDAGAVVTEPSAGKKAAGFAAPELPADGEFNWMLHWLCAWIAYVNDQLPVATPAAIPAGAIILWTGNSCPAGWTRDDTFADKFIQGATVGQNPGGTGGASTHSHDLGSHTHTYSGTTVGAQQDSSGSNYGVAAGYNHMHNYSGTTASASGNTGSASTLPPYSKVLFCKKD